jgi:hypothetical protein
MAFSLAVDFDVVNLSAIKIDCDVIIFATNSRYREI